VTRSFDLEDPEAIGVGTVGPAGQRQFYLRASGGGETIVLNCEKFHIQGLVTRMRQLLEAQGMDPGMLARIRNYLDLRLEAFRRMIRQHVERELERRGASDQDHVISYSQAAQRRISAEQFDASQLAQAAPGQIALDRALERAADCDTDAVLRARAGNRKSDQAPAAEDSLAVDRSLELALPAEPVTPLHRGAAVSC